MSNTNFPNGVSVGGYVECVGVTINVGTEDTNVVNVDLDFLDGAGDNVNRAVSVVAWVSDTAGGDVAATAPDGGVAAGANGSVAAMIAGKMLIITSDATGNADLDVTESGTDTFYVNVLLPNGRVVSSAALTFAA